MRSQQQQQQQNQFRTTTTTAAAATHASLELGQQVRVKEMKRKSQTTTRPRPNAGPIRAQSEPQTRKTHKNHKTTKATATISRCMAGEWKSLPSLRLARIGLIQYWQSTLPYRVEYSRVLSYIVFSLGFFSFHSVFNFNFFHSLQR